MTAADRCGIAENLRPVEWLVDEYGRRYHWHDGPDEFVDYGVAGGGWRSTQWRCYLPCCEQGHDWMPPVRVGLIRRRTVQQCRYRSLPYQDACYAERSAA